MDRRLTMLVAVWVTLLPGGVSLAQQRSQPRKTAGQRSVSADAPEPGSLSLQREKLELDRQKFASDVDVENKKLGIERDKLHVEESASMWSALSATGPLV